MDLGLEYLSRHGKQLRARSSRVIVGDGDSLGGGQWRDASVRSCGRDSLFALEALPAKDGAPLGWLEGDGGLDAALGALGAGLGARKPGCRWSGTSSGRGACPCRLTGLTALRVVLELLVEEK